MTPARRLCYAAAEITLFPRGDAGEAGFLGGRIDDDDKGLWRATLKYSAVGLEMGVAIGLGVLIGHWLDGKFATRPYLTLAMLGLGIATAFRGLYRVARQMQRESAEPSDSGNGDSPRDDSSDGASKH